MVKQNKTELSEKTLITYQAVINGIRREIGLPNDDDDNSRWITSNWTKILKVIRGSSSKHTAKNRAAVLKVWVMMYDLPDKYSLELDEIMTELANDVQNEYSTNTMNDKQKENWMTVEELRGVLEKLRGKLPVSVNAIDTYNEYKQLLQYFMLLIHLDSPLRNDLACAKIYKTADLPEKQDPDTNYISVGKSCKLYLNEYKTKKDYGVKVIDFGSDVSRDLNKYMEVFERMSPNHWFMMDRHDSNKCISRTTYTKWFNDIFSDMGKKVSSTQIRRAVVSDLYDVDENESKKKAELASKMGHSVAIASLVYAKHEPNKK
jgi:hypothetical protein